MEAISTAPEQNRRVMVAMDDSEESFYALNWALENPFVYHTGPVVFATSTVIDTYRKSQQQMAKVVLSKALQMCKEKMVKAETLVVEGDPKDKICQAAEEMNVDLLVVGSRGLGNITRHVEKPEYQNYGKLTFIEIDDVINYKLPDHPSKTLFDVKRENKEKGEIMIKTNTRNLSCRKEILLSVFEEDDFAKTEGYYHVALVQVMVMWLGNTMQDIPLTIVALDDRLADEKQKIMGIFSSDLYPRATYTELYTDLTISARDPTKLQAFLLDIKAKVEFEIPQSLGLSVSLKVTYSWTLRPQAFRIRDKMSSIPKYKQKLIERGYDPDLNIVEAEHVLKLILERDIQPFNKNEVIHRLGLIFIKYSDEWEYDQKDRHMKEFKENMNSKNNPIEVNVIENLIEEKSDGGEDILNALKQYDPRSPTGYRGRLIGENNRPPIRKIGEQIIFPKELRIEMLTNGNIEQGLRPDTFHQRRVFDKGILLSLANPNTWDAELKAWETSMAVYFGNHPEMAVEERLKYMVATMTDFARIWWSIYETTPEYERKALPWTMVVGRSNRRRRRTEEVDDVSCELGWRWRRRKCRRRKSLRFVVYFVAADGDGVLRLDGYGWRTQVRWRQWMAVAAELVSDMGIGGRQWRSTVAICSLGSC
nr:universal stress protein A-like protein [Ipomoea batatas]